MSQIFGNQGGSYGRPQIRFGGPLTPVVKTLLIINGVIFFLMAIPSLTPGGEEVVNIMKQFLGMTPALFWTRFTIWMPLSYMFIHANFMHVGFNMLALWMFGGEVEKVFGSGKFLYFYIVCGAGAGLFVAILQAGLTIPTIGASGSIYGLLIAYGLLFPERIIYLYMVFPVKVKYFIIGLTVMVLLSSLASNNPFVSNVAHLGGIVVGFVLIKWKQIGSIFTRRRRRKKNMSKAEVVELEKIRKMFEDLDDDNRVH